MLSVPPRDGWGRGPEGPAIAPGSALDAAPHGIALLGADERFAYANEAYARLVGYRLDELVGLPWQAGVHPDARESMRALLESAIAEGRARGEVRGLRKDGASFRQEIALVADVGSGGRLCGIHLYSSDIGERARDRRVVELARDGIVVVDRDGRTSWASGRFEEMVGAGSGQLAGRALAEFVDARDRAAFQLGMDRARDGREDERTVLLRPQDGPAICASVRTAPLDPAQPWQGVLVIATDVSEQRRLERQLATLAQVDSLTRRPNRRLLEERVRQAVDRAAREGTTVALAFIALDRFAAVNEGLGHRGGDAVLRAVADRLETHAAPGDTLARVGGDVFALLCPDAGGRAGAVELAARLRESFEEPILTEHGVVRLTAGIGVALGEAGARPEALLRDAETAMQAAKERGGARYEVCDRSMRARVTQEVALQGELESALENGDLFLVYQPVVDLVADRIWGFEAFLRWRHPDRGVVLPGAFLGAAERSGLIRRLGMWTLEEACRQVAGWSASQGQHPWARVAINVSTQQLMEPGFADAVRGILEDAGLEPAALALEITDSVPLEHTRRCAETLAALSAAGVRVTLDDFGSGYCSLGELRRFPASGLKIERSFVAELDAPQSSRPIVEAVAAMTRGLELSFVAGGVENESQLHTLEQLGCEYAQGYLFARPMSADRVVPWVTARRPARRQGARPRPSADQEARTVTLQEAASALGVSPSTLRRWADSGRIQAARTTGGHRRFPLSEVRRLAQASTGVNRVRGAALPAEPQPAFADLLETAGDDLLEATLQSIYEGRGRGWFASDGAQRHVEAWLRGLAHGARHGDYRGAVEASTSFFRHARLGGSSLLERHLFVERFGMAVLKTLQRRGQAEAQPAASRLFTAIRHDLLRDEV